MTITALSREQVVDRTHPRWRERLGSVGTAHSCVEVRITDAQGNELPRGEIGEILVSGSTVMTGYWKNDKATAETIRDGWLWTGDMGSMDADGFVTLRDRSKDMIISGGTNIYPRDPSVRGAGLHRRQARPGMGRNRRRLRCFGVRI